ncbi:MAG: metal-sensing transcriptional repressor [Enterocloster sp.]
MHRYPGQVSAIQSALNGFSRTLLSSHVKSCVVEEIKNGDADKAVDELCETIRKML